MSERLDHVRATREDRERIWRTAYEKWGIRRKRWSSWRRHPWSNSVYKFWGVMPHLPRWEVTETQSGHAGFTNRKEADWVHISDRCRRCGLEQNGTTFVRPTEPVPGPSEMDYLIQDLINDWEILGEDFEFPDEMNPLMHTIMLIHDEYVK